MSAAQEELLEDKVFRDLNWVAYNGGFVHSNNGSLTLKLSSFVVDINSYPVLFYFAESPFFDRTSNNSSIFGQALGDVRFQSFLATRKNFEGRLRQLSGLEYVVVYDPLELNVQIDGPNGKEISNIWVIAKQNRQKRMGIDDQVIVLAYYYIVGDSIYQAPSVAKVLTNRLLSSVTSLTQMLSIAAPLPTFTVSHGNTYFPPVQMPQNPAQLSLSQQSKENTPLPDAHDAASGRASKPSESQYSDFQDTQILVESIRMSLRYGKEYMDDTPLVGEPGNFRLSKTKDALARPATAAQQAKRETSPPNEKTSTPVPPPPIKTEVTAVESKKSAKGNERSPTTPGAPPKAKRRKSRMASSSAA